MKKINLKLLNATLWIEVILAYVLPFRVTDGFQYQVGFPIPFLTVYQGNIGVNPLASMHLNPVGFLLNGLLIYLVASVCIKAYRKRKGGA